VETAEILCSVSKRPFLTGRRRIHALPLWRLVSVAQVAAVGQVEAHEPVVRPHDGLVDLQVGRAAAQALHVDTPLLCVQTERRQSAGLAQQLDAVNVLVAAVVARTGVALRVLVGHGRAERIEDSAGCDVLRGDEEDRLALALDFLLLLHLSDVLCCTVHCIVRSAYHDLGDLIVRVHQGLLHELSDVSIKHSPEKRRLHTSWWDLGRA
jgi:hypothetical protein